MLGGIIAVLLAASAADDSAAAREHYQRAERHYDLGEFDEAAAEYKEAYRLLPAPALPCPILSTGG
jgi:tetratricopeptide (TPR) repeat protein